jgi:hypothetical protein
MFDNDQLDFALAKQWNQGDVQFIDIDLSVARVKPEAVELGGRFLGVATLAYDDKYTVSSSKSVGNALICLNENQGEPLELTKGVSYDLLKVFDRLWIRNAAQSGKMLRLMVSSTVKFFPFSSETSTSVTNADSAGLKVQPVGNNSTFSKPTVTDTSSQLLASTTNVIARFIKNLGPNTVYINSITATVANGFPLYVGETQELKHTNVVNAICDSGLTSVVATYSTTR